MEWQQGGDVGVGLSEFTGNPQGIHTRHPIPDTSWVELHQSSAHHPILWVLQKPHAADLLAHPLQTFLTFTALLSCHLLSPCFSHLQAC
jgi:hypothetical protein